MISVLPPYGKDRAIHLVLLVAVVEIRDGCRNHEHERRMKPNTEEPCNVASPATNYAAKESVSKAWSTKPRMCCRICPIEYPHCCANNHSRSLTLRHNLLVVVVLNEGGEHFDEKKELDRFGFRFIWPLDTMEDEFTPADAEGVKSLKKIQNTKVKTEDREAAQDLARLKYMKDDTLASTSVKRPEKKSGRRSRRKSRKSSRRKSRKA